MHGIQSGRSLLNLHMVIGIISMTDGWGVVCK